MFKIKSLFVRQTVKTDADPRMVANNMRQHVAKPQKYQELELFSLFLSVSMNCNPVE